MEAWKETVTWIAGALSLGGASVVKHTLGTRKGLADHQRYAAETFVTKKHHERAEDRVLVVLDRIEVALANHIRDTAK